jgi:hypothetical protein
MTIAHLPIAEEMSFRSLDKRIDIGWLIVLNCGMAALAAKPSFIKR